MNTTYIIQAKNDDGTWMNFSDDIDSKKDGIVILEKMSRNMPAASLRLVSFTVICEK